MLYLTWFLNMLRDVVVRLREGQDREQPSGLAVERADLADPICDDDHTEEATLATE